MPKEYSIHKLLKKDPRYKLEAYLFVREALAYAQEVLDMGDEGGRPKRRPEQEGGPRVESHLTGQQLCDAIRLYAIAQFGLMAKVVLNSWGINTTSDFGEIVYNLIDIKEMKKSPTDRREDFNDVYDFDEVFQRQFEIKKPE